MNVDNAWCRSTITFWFGTFTHWGRLRPNVRKKVSPPFATDLNAVIPPNCVFKTFWRDEASFSSDLTHSTLCNFLQRLISSGEGNKFLFGCPFNLKVPESEPPPKGMSSSVRKTAVCWPGESGSVLL